MPITCSCGASPRRSVVNITARSERFRPGLAMRCKMDCVVELVRIFCFGTEVGISSGK